MGEAPRREYGQGMDDEKIQTLVTRLARPHRSGGAVIERAAILAEGEDFTAVVAWITAHDGQPEAAAVAASKSRGLHGSRAGEAIGASPREPLRYVLPAGALG